MSDKLKPCHMCGKPPLIEYGKQRDENFGYFIFCGPCDLEQFTCGDEDSYCMHEAVERWNTRAAVGEGGKHCKDCCCARSWKALGIKEYTGLSIPEHILELKRQLFELKGGFESQIPG